MISSIDVCRPRSGWVCRLSPLVACLLLGLSSVISGTAHAQTAEGPGSNGPVPIVSAQMRAIDLVQPALVWVRVDWEAFVLTDKGAIKASFEYGCSGFTVNPDGYIVTAGHCIDDGMEGGGQRTAVEYAVDELIAGGRIRRSDRKRLIDAVMRGDIRWEIEGTGPGSRPDRVVHVQIGGGDLQWRDNAEPAAGVPARVLDFLPWGEGEVALLKVEKNLPVALLVPKSNIQVGQELLSIGYDPASATATNTVTVSGRNGKVKSIDSTAVNRPSNHFYETSARLTPGMSGGPSVNLQGQAVGLNSLRTEEGRPYIIPSFQVLEMLNRDNVKNEQGRLDLLYREGLDKYYRGYHSDAIKYFDQVLAVLPQHKQAMDKKALAADLRQRFGDQPKPVPPPPGGSGWGIPVIAAGLALSMISVLFGGWWWRRRRLRAHRLPAGDGSIQPRRER